MAKVYTTTPGATARIGNFGVATNDTPAVVPEEVAAELERDMLGEEPVETIEADPDKGIKAVEGRPRRHPLGPIYRIEREPGETAASRARRSAPAPVLPTGDLKDAQKAKGE